ncbi:MAG: hemin uptake protein HemP [Sneathiella sp.]|uniref:hemin uptake protein HemP n=1 Tax=Sneathiella sp. TaxID=1964365 RepID=UPI0030017AEF
MLNNSGNGQGSKRMISLVDNTLLSTELFRQSRELKITHESEEYKLRLTGNGKLILTK